MKRYRRLSLVPLFLLCAYAVEAQENGTLSIEDAIAIGLRNNFDIRIARVDAEIARNNTAFGTANFLPTLDLTGSYGLSDSRQTTTSPFSFGNQTGSSGNATIGLNWTLFDGMRMFADNTRYRELARLGEDRARLVIEQTVVGILRAYFNVVQQEEFLDVARETLATSRDRLAREEVRRELGGASSTDYLNAQVVFNSDSTTLLVQILDAEIARQNLNILLGRDPTVPVTVRRSVDLPELEDAYDALLLQARQRNAGLSSVRRQQRIAEESVTLARSPFFPRLALYANYGYTDRLSNSDRFEYDISTQSTDGTLGLSLSFNLFNGFRNDTETENAKLSAEIGRLQVLDEENRVAGQLRATWLTFHQRRETVQLEESNVLAAEQNLRLMRDRYDTGTAGSLEYRDAQIKLARAQSVLIAARYQTRITYLELRQLIGDIPLE